ncbi:16 kDa phloem protein 1 [Heracleum sosnowskyi]|uniref:16 kDa phloem protein 1 n=1 Tax=Heracleum sosnowskyi TaxID=360622 RepID=A0AAD8HD24_9APIA|nr:16 kDa phloem protein 1 [Heracleum sosnowskyi]
MTEAILEILLVGAKGLKHTNLVGKPSYFVIIECGKKVGTSKISRANHKEIIWNGKFLFAFPTAEWEHITHLKLKIIEAEYFTDGRFVGETIVNLKGIMLEGNDKGVIELRPTRYNVVLEDDSYKGEIKLGLKFITNGDSETKRREFVAEGRNSDSICNTIMKVWNMTWGSVLCFCRKTNYDYKEKGN